MVVLAVERRNVEIAQFFIVHNHGQHNQERQRVDKVLSDGYESRNSHCYAVVVPTQWIQVVSVNKTSQETPRSLQNFWEPDKKSKVIYTDNSLEFGKACEDLSWNHCTSTPQRSETNGIAASSSSSPTVIFPVPVSNSVDDRSGQPDDETQANKNQKQIKRKPR